MFFGILNGIHVFFPSFLWDIYYSLFSRCWEILDDVRQRMISAHVQYITTVLTKFLMENDTPNGWKIVFLGIIPPIIEKLQLFFPVPNGKSTPSGIYRESCLFFCGSLIKSKILPLLAVCNAFLLFQLRMISNNWGFGRSWELSPSITIYHLKMLVGDCAMIGMSLCWSDSSETWNPETCPLHGNHERHSEASVLPSGELTVCHGKSPFFYGKIHYSYGHFQ